MCTGRQHNGASTFHDVGVVGLASLALVVVLNPSTVRFDAVSIADYGGVEEATRKVRRKGRLNSTDVGVRARSAFLAAAV